MNSGAYLNMRSALGNLFCIYDSEYLHPAVMREVFGLRILAPRQVVDFADSISDISIDLLLYLEDFPLFECCESVVESYREDNDDWDWCWEQRVEDWIEDAEYCDEDGCMPVSVYSHGGRLIIGDRGCAEAEFEAPSVEDYCDIARKNALDACEKGAGAGMVGGVISVDWDEKYCEKYCNNLFEKGVTEYLIPSIAERIKEQIESLDYGFCEEDGDYYNCWIDNAWYDEFEGKEREATLKLRIRRV